MQKALQQLRASVLFKNTLWMASGNGLRLVIQLAYFVIIARSLGPNQYGAFVAIVAVAALLEPFVGLGSSNLLVKNVVYDQNLFSVSLGNSLVITAVTGILGMGLVCALRFALPSGIHWTPLLLIASANLFFGRITDLCGFAFGSVERFGMNAQINVWSSLSRLIGLGALVLVNAHPTVEEWSWVYLAATIATSIASYLAVVFTLGKPSFRLRMMTGELGEGFFFSAGQSAQTIYNDLDKTMLAKLGDLSSTGIYGAAYRIIDVTLVPAKSMLSAAYPSIFRAGRNGIQGSLAYTRRLLLKPVLLSIVISIGLFVGAPTIPSILGKDYVNSVYALRWLSLLPLLKTVHFFLADTLTGAGYQRLRTVIQALVAAFNVVINLWIIPVYSWRGAAWSSLASDGLLLASYWTALSVISERQKRATQASLLAKVTR